MKKLKYLLVVVLLIIMKFSYSQNWWTYVSLIDLGIGLNTYNGSSLGIPLCGHTNALHIAVGFDKMKGLGFGTALIDGYFFPGLQTASLAPIYLYFPLKISKPKDNSVIRDRRPWFLSLYSGGSLWAIESENTNDSFKRYCNIGIIGMKTWDILGGKEIYGLGNFNLRSGFMFGKTFYDDPMTLFYVTIGIGIGSSVTK